MVRVKWLNSQKYLKTLKSQEEEEYIYIYIYFVSKKVDYVQASHTKLFVIWMYSYTPCIKTSIEHNEE